MKNIKHLFVPYEIAKQLKEKGFNEECFMVYNSHREGIPGYPTLERPINYRFLRYDYTVYNYHLNKLNTKLITAPLYQQVIDWFRVKHKINIQWNIYGGFAGIIGHIYDIDKPLPNTRWEETKTYQKFYKMLDEAIKKAFELI